MKTDYLIAIISFLIVAFSCERWGEAQRRLDVSGAELHLLYGCIVNNVLQVQRQECRNEQVVLKTRFEGK